MKKLIVIGLFIAVTIAVFLSPLASSHPDGLEKVAEDKNFLQAAEEKEIIKAPVPDYSMPGIKNETVAGSVAGLIGTIIVFCIAYGIGLLLKSRRRSIRVHTNKNNLST